MKQLINCYIALLAIVLSGCTKHESESNPKWNALSFTESTESEYSKYMNLPHLSFSFPSEIQSGKISVQKGIWKLGEMSYTLSPHNFLEGEILFYLIKNGNIEQEIKIDPLSQVNTEIELTAGVYSFGASLKDNRGVVELKIYPLYESQNRMVVN